MSEDYHILTVENDGEIVLPQDKEIIFKEFVRKVINHRFVEPDWDWLLLSKLPKNTRELPGSQPATEASRSFVYLSPETFNDI